MQSDFKMLTSCDGKSCTFTTTCVLPYRQLYQVLSVHLQVQPILHQYTSTQILVQLPVKYTKCNTTHPNDASWGSL